MILKHNPKKCTMCMNCIIHCNGKAMMLNSKMYEKMKSKHEPQKCLICYDGGKCDAAESCKNGCFEVVK